jgi:hypothetical protein
MDSKEEEEKKGGSGAAQGGDEQKGGAGAEAPAPPQELGRLVVVLGGQAIPLSSLRPPENPVAFFPLIRVILGGNPSMPNEYQATAMARLVQMVIARSQIMPEQLELLRRDPLKTYLAISAVIEHELAATMQ